MHNLVYITQKTNRHSVFFENILVAPRTKNGSAIFI